jgi:DHA1 family multidrug resistance protein-like MFS transporter
MGLITSKEKDGSLFPIYLSVFVAVLGFSLVAPIFPLYVINLGASYTLLGFIISIYGAVQLITQIPIGRISDKVGRKPLIILGLIFFTLLPPLYIYATNAILLIPIRILGGIGASAVWPLAMALIVDKVSRESRGASMGRYNAAFYSAMAVGPMMGGYLYDIYGLQAPFYFWALLGLISIIIVKIKVTEPSHRQSLSIAHSGRPDESLILPGYWRTFLACCGVVMWTGIVGGFNITMLPSYASHLGLSTTEIGLLYLDYAGITALSNIYFGRAADRGRRKLLVFAGCLAGLMAFFFLPWATNLSGVLVLMAVIGLGLGIGNPAAAALIADVTCETRRGEIFGLFNTARMSGVVVGPLIAGLTADLYGVNGAILAFTGISLAITMGTFVVKEPRDS